MPGYWAFQILSSSFIIHFQLTLHPLVVHQPTWLWIYQQMTEQWQLFFVHAVNKQLCFKCSGIFLTKQWIYFVITHAFVISNVSLWVVQSHISCIKLYRVFYWDAHMLFVIMWTALFPSCTLKIVAMGLSSSSKYPYCCCFLLTEEGIHCITHVSISVYSLLKIMTSHTT